MNMQTLALAGHQRNTNQQHNWSTKVMWHFWMLSRTSPLRLHCLDILAQKIAIGREMHRFPHDALASLTGCKPSSEQHDPDDTGHRNGWHNEHASASVAKLLM